MMPPMLVLLLYDNRKVNLNIELLGNITKLRHLLPTFIPALGLLILG